MSSNTNEPQEVFPVKLDDAFDFSVDRHFEAEVESVPKASSAPEPADDSALTVQTTPPTTETIPSTPPTPEPQTSSEPSTPTTSPSPDDDLPKTVLPQAPAPAIPAPAAPAPAVKDQKKSPAPA